MTMNRMESRSYTVATGRASRARLRPWSSALCALALVVLLVAGGGSLRAQPAAPVTGPLWSFGGFNLQRTNATPRPGALISPHVAWKMPFETAGTPVWVAPPAVADLDRDGSVEAVYGEGTRLVALERPWPRRRWDFRPVEGLVLMTPALADVDGDRRAEVFFAPFQFPRSTFFRLDWRGREVWRFEALSFTSYASPAVADLDGDGRFLVIFADRGGTVYALDAATGRPRWTYAMGGNADMNAPAIVDLDRDGKQEIVIGNHGNGTIHAIDSEGRRRWVAETRGEIYSVTVVDADRDGTPEIYAADKEGAIHSLSADGRLRWTARKRAPVTAYNGLTVADLDRDGTKEIVVGIQDGSVVALSPGGRTLWHFGARGNISGSIAAGDFDRDGHLEVIVGTHPDGFVHMIGSGGVLKWKHRLGGRLAFMGITAEDLDGDGLVEVLINNDDSLFAFSRPPRR